MITMIRWILLKQKEIKVKLAFYSALEQGMKYISENKEALEEKFVHAFAELIHNANQNN